MFLNNIWTVFVDLSIGRVPDTFLNYLLKINSLLISPSCWVVSISNFALVNFWHHQTSQYIKNFVCVWLDNYIYISLIVIDYHCPCIDSYTHLWVIHLWIYFCTVLSSNYILKENIHIDFWCHHGVYWVCDASYGGIFPRRVQKPPK